MEFLLSIVKIRGGENMQYVYGGMFVGVIVIAAMELLVGNYA